MQFALKKISGPVEDVVSHYLFSSNNESKLEVEVLRPASTEYISLEIVSLLKPALILGSNQDGTVFDERTLLDSKVEIARRKSGGSAVYVSPLDFYWLNVNIPSSKNSHHFDIRKTCVAVGRSIFRSLEDELKDVGRCFHLNETFNVNLPGKIYCFFSKGPGEIFFNEAKCVGLSMRTSKYGSTAQIGIYRKFDTEMHKKILKKDVIEGSNLDILDGRVKELRELDFYSFVERMAHFMEIEFG